MSENTEDSDIKKEEASKNLVKGEVDSEGLLKESELDSSKSDEKPSLEGDSGNESQTEAEKVKEEEPDIGGSNPSDLEQEDEEEEGGDDDDDDDEEEDGDGDDVHRRKRRRGNQFLDVEAEVDEDEDEDEDDEEAELLKKDFLADDEAPEAASAVAESHIKLDRSREKLDEEDAQALAAQFRERYGRSASSRYMGSGAKVSQRLLLPSVDDPSIWGIHVKHGREKSIVRQLYARMFNMKNVEGVYSAFQRDDFEGYIYVEARRIDVVDRILSGIPGIYITGGKVLVPIDEYPDLLRPGKPEDHEVKPGSYVRIRSGKYKGDLGVVDNLADNGLEVRVKLIPRLDYGRGVGSLTGRGRRGYHKGMARPPQKLFSQYSASQYDPEHLTTARTERNFFVYRNEEYIDGYLFKDISTTHLVTKDIRPTLRELELFGMGNDSKGQDIEGEPEGSMPVDINKMARSLKKAQSSSILFQPGDRIVVSSGEQTGMHGHVTSVAGNGKIVEVILKDSSTKEEVEVPASALRKVFLPGDHVTVVRGVHSGESGMIVQVQQKQVTLISDQTGKDVTVFANYLQRSVDRGTVNIATESAEQGGSGDGDGESANTTFELHQVVRLNPTEVGLVIRVEKNALSVLRTDGRVIRVEPEQIQSAVELDRMTEKTTDRSGNEVKVGDVVKEVHGEKRQGNVLHVLKTTLFVRSKSLVANSGIFVVDADTVQILSAHTDTSTNSPAVAISGAFKMPDLSRMNPNRMAHPQASISSSKFGGRDPTIHQYVSVRKGPYKGKKGLVKDANGPMARVEMHNPAKIVPINKVDLLFEVRPGQYIAYEQFAESRGRGRRSGRGERGGRGYAGATSRPPIANVGSGSPMWSSSSPRASAISSAPNSGAPAGGRTPSWSSSRTPSWGGKTPGWGNSGEKTPSWSSGGGKTPAWGSGSRSSWGGSSIRGQKTSYGGNTSYGGSTAYGGSSSYGGKTSYGGSTAYGGNAWKPTGSNGGQAKSSDWGSTPSTGDWDAPTPVAPKKEDDNYIPE